MKYLLQVMAAIGLVIASSGGAQAQCYTNSVPYYPRTEYIEKIVPVAFPVPFTVAVPVLSYLYNGGYSGNFNGGYSPLLQAQPVNYGQAFSGQLAGAMPQQVQSQPQVQPQAQPAGLTEADLDKLANLIIARLERGPTASKPPKVPGNVTAVDLDSQLISAFNRPLGREQKSCASCHTASGSKGRIVLFSQPGVLNQRVDWAKVFTAADIGDMPPEAKQNKDSALSDQEVELIKRKRDLIKK